ncbi:hypothetical protein ACSBR2_005178 [Camellia fascicularis]
MILSMCSNYYTKNGNILPMNDEERTQFEMIIKDMSAKSLRCIAFGYRKCRERTCGSGHKGWNKRCTRTERRRYQTFNGNSRRRSGKRELGYIVILDYNFTSVVTILKWGRCIYNNTQKFIQFQLSINVATFVVNFVEAISSGEVLLTAVQLLWVNLIMDTLRALALATEQPTNDLMTKQPVGRTEPLITKIMWRNLIAQALYQITILLILEFKGSTIFGMNNNIKDTLVFNSFVPCQVFNEFNARKMEEMNIFKGIVKNKLFLGIIEMTVVLQVVMVEFLKKFADTERLNWGQWVACIVIAAISWPIGWLVKFIPISSKQFISLPIHRSFVT